LESEEFKRLESEYKFLSHAREHLLGKGSELEQIPLIIFDLETTGLDPVKNEIIEIGAMKIESGEIKGIFNKLINPGSPLTSEIVNITGITDEMLKDAPKIKDVLPGFLEFIGQSSLIAHNADFDMSFIRDKLKTHLGRDLRNQSICTLMLSRILLPNLGNHKLHTVAGYFKIPLYARHRAIGDVEATFQVWQNMAFKLKEKGVSTKADLDKFIASNLRETPF
jgi:DNA polymerase-3 subunit alpha (Gram-positive type)